MTQSVRGNLATENMLMALLDVKEELISVILHFIFDFLKIYFGVKDCVTRVCCQSLTGQLIFSICVQIQSWR